MFQVSILGPEHIPVILSTFLTQNKFFALTRGEDPVVTRHMLSYGGTQ